MRIALVDFCDDGVWPRAQNRFAGLDSILKDLGHEARLITISRTSPGRTVVAGAGRESHIEPLIASVRALAALEAPVDLVVCPLRGGIAHGLLMARACGELPVAPKVALWCDGASRAELMVGDYSADEGLRLLVADAMERICLDHADCLVASRQEMVDIARSIADRPLPAAHIAPWLTPARAQAAVAGPLRLAFVGQLAQRCGLFAFVEAVERLANEDGREIVDVAFVTWRDDAASRDGARWLELRTRRWTFPIRIVEVASDADTARMLTEEGLLAVVCRRDETEIPEWLAKAGETVVVSLDAEAQSWSLSIGQALRARIAGSEPAPCTQGDWATLLDEIGAPSPATATPRLPSISVCMLHFDRPVLLEAALTSFVEEARDPSVETIIVDNASRLPEAHALIGRLETAGAAKIIRTGSSQPLPEAYNHAIRAARGDYVVFLDDDNAFTPGGLARLRRACATGAFDVVVSNLDMFDDDAEDVAGPYLAFVGQARSAGLFFNAFGDTSMAFRREALQALGGYLELGAPYPSPDWLLLARAQAAGLRIGVLQQPSHRYRRRPLDAPPVWQKFDARSPRRLVMNHFGGAYDAAMLARLAQLAMLEL